MKTIIFFAVLSYFADARIINENCDGPIVHNIKHEKEVLKSGIDSPYQLTIDYDTNTLFFSYSVSNSDTSFESAYINLKTNEFKIIKGIVGGFANAVDKQQHIVYLGGRDGIYKFDYATKTAQHIEGTNDNIWQLFFKKELYYTKYPEEEVYILKNNEPQRVPELIETRGMLVAVDNFDNIYFSNSSGLYIHKKIKNYISYIGDYNVNGFASDMDGKLFFSTPDGIFYIDDSSKKSVRLTTIPTVYGVAVESDGNIIYASQDSIVRLKPTKINCNSAEIKNI